MDYLNSVSVVIWLLTGNQVIEAATSRPYISLMRLEHRSSENYITFEEYPSWLMTSGAIYHGVPTKVLLVFVSLLVYKQVRGRGL